MAFSDIVIVEGYDSGLHIDLSIKLLETAEELGRRVVIETHVGLLTTWFLKKGWRSYYFDNGVSREITRENISSMDLFRRERELFYG